LICVKRALLKVQPWAGNKGAISVETDLRGEFQPANFAAAGEHTHQDILGQGTVRDCSTVIGLHCLVMAALAPVAGSQQDSQQQQACAEVVPTPLWPVPAI
jgi:hypothetical protein